MQKCCILFGCIAISCTGQSATFDLKIKPAPNFPLDLYFLMDFSYSMKNDLNKMKSLALDICKFPDLFLV